jgi:hypothetical protein
MVEDSTEQEQAAVVSEEAPQETEAEPTPRKPRTPGAALPLPPAAPASARAPPPLFAVAAGRRKQTEGQGHGERRRRRPAFRISQPDHSLHALQKERESSVFRDVCCVEQSANDLPWPVVAERRSTRAAAVSTREARMQQCIVHAGAREAEAWSGFCRGLQQLLLSCSLVGRTVTFMQGSRSIDQEGIMQGITQDQGHTIRAVHVACVLSGQ